ncbi:bromodomain adjacent to zinc finger domain protein 2B isoform X2 [Ixodes scapularis]|uniref:bromodomain adjacent to zinc finger domain protein 2B isoform X2 n=1 Tax=Ixodes scapularis TaxID=6945 RepID=UPI001A9DDDCF|nr:bromodomain adjacent to zinc finger domain protein 2B isoform X2 [Ixodes scapularis]
MDNSNRNAASSPVKNHFDAAALLGAWWSSADQGGMTLASLLRQGTSSGLASGSKLDHALRQPSPQTRRRMNGSQAPGKMLPPSAHSRSSKHLDLLQDSLILNSVKEKLLLGSAKGPPSLAPVAPGSPFLAHGGELLSKGLGHGAEGSSRPGITLPLGSLVRERAGGAHKRSRRGRRDPGLAASAAGKLAECLMLKQPPTSSSPLPGSSSGHLGSSPSLFPSPAHSSGPSPRHPSSSPAHTEAPPSSRSGDSMPLDLCVKRSGGPPTTFLSPDVTLTPVGSTSHRGPSPHLPQRHILETLPASLGGLASAGGGASLGPSSSSSRRRGRRPRGSSLLADLAPPRDCSPMGLLLGALAAQDAKLSPKEQESLQRFQLLASQGYKSRNNLLQKHGGEFPHPGDVGGGATRLPATSPTAGLGPPRPLGRELPPSSRMGLKRLSPDGDQGGGPHSSGTRPRGSHRHRSKRQELENSVSASDSSSDSESAVADSRSMSGGSDTEDTERSAAASTSGSIPASSVSDRVSKRHTEEHGTSSKRRRYVTDEREIRIPLEHGWQRQTRIKCFSKSGVRGEVTYIAPCGKKLRNYPEVLRYLQKNGIADIGRENFSFSSRVIVGVFLESVDGGESTDGCTLLSEEEVAARLRVVCGLPQPALAMPASVSRGPLGGPGTGPSSGGSRRGRPRSRPSPDPQERALAEAAILQHRRLEQQHAEEARRQQEHEKLLKQQERLERLEQQRIEKELRAQQMIEIRRKRREELERQRQEDAVRRTQEREMKRQQAVMLREQEMQKRREMLLMVDLERERRRQHMLLVRALENRKKMEDQKKVELQILKEVRRPVEDMILKDALPLPTLNRIPGLKVPGTAFANLLMVREFLHNFGETLHFDLDKIPSLNSLQLGLINHDVKSEQQLLSVVQHLLVCAIHDPGTLHCKEAVTVLGQHLKDAPITNDSLTEALHLYFMALDKECAMYQWVTEKPFLALNPTQKSEILAFLCNELLCSRAVVRQVDTSIETVNTLRKDKWLAEGELRKLRGIQQGRQRKAILKQELENNNSGANSSAAGSQNNGGGSVSGVSANKDKESEEGSIKGDTPSEGGDKASKNGREEEEENEDGANDSGNESDDPQEVENMDEEEDSEPSLTNEELEKKIDKLAKSSCAQQQAQFQSKVAKASSSIRAVMLGQDRFRRRYWLLPVAGGVFVEAMESCEQDGMGDFVATDYMADEDEDNTSEDSSLPKSKASVKEEGKETPAEGSPKIPKEEVATRESNSAETPAASAGKEEDVKAETEVKAELEEKAVCKDEEDGKVEEASKVKVEEGAAKEPPAPVTTTSAATLSAMTLSTASLPPPHKSKSPLPEPTLEQSWMMHSPFFASIIAGNMLFNNGSFPSSSPSPQLAGGKEGAALLEGFPSVSAEQMLKNLAQKRPKPWFSVLPRIPCDEESVARLPGTGKDGDDDDLEEEVVLLGTPGARIVSIIETEDTTNQHDKAQPVPLEYLRGWWRITDSSQLRTLMAALHSNGIREKALLKQLEKNFNYGLTACIPNSQQDVGLEITDLDREVSEKHGGAPPPDYEDQWSPEVALRVDLAILAQVEALEHKVLGASMQVKGWRPPPKVSDDPSQEYRPSCVLLHKKLLASSDEDDEDDSSTSPTSNVSSPGTKEKSQNTEKDSKEPVEVCVADEGAPATQLEESVSDEPPKELAPKAAPKEAPTAGTDNFVNPIEVTKERLLNLEMVIERRYMRPPLGTSGNSVPQTGSGASGGNKSDEEGASGGGAGSSAAGPAAPGEEEEVVVPPGLARWREAVAACQTAAQLAMCLSHLEGSIAWDRSIMKASCQFCRSGDNEEMLLLCDGCDKGYHTYCFKPKMDRIPDGDWYCYECLNKTQDEKLCVLCGKKGKLVRCDACPKVFHLTCLEPPLSKPPKGKWTCSGCSKNRKKGRPSKESKDQAGKEAKEAPPSKKGEGAAPATASPSKAAKASERREKNKSQVLKDLAACRQILDELEQHKDAWPFLLPVNTKQFPSYRKFIKKPMDVSTMRSKLDANQYKGKDEFAVDARLIFDNCETFNEDDSPVGQAGHNMRTFFESRWEELTS